MNAAALTKRIVELQELQLKIHQLRMASGEWCLTAKYTTRQSRQAAVLMLDWHALAQTLMDEILKSSTEATMLRTTLHEQALGTMAQETFH
jgi:hypothetical protein